MASKKNQPDGRAVFTPKDTFVGSYNGVPTTFMQDRTLVREGHELLGLFPDMFREVRVQYDVEQATAAPGEVRAAA